MNITQFCFVLIIIFGLQFLILRSGLNFLIKKIDDEIVFEQKKWNLIFISIAATIECGLLIIADSFEIDISSATIVFIVLLLNLIGFIDAKTGSVYFIFSIPLFVLCILYDLMNWNSFIDSVIPILLTALICLVSNKLGGMGTGDLEIFIALSISSGFNTLFVIFFSLFFGGVGAIIRAIIGLVKREKSRNIFTCRKPLCPYIALAFFVCKMLLPTLDFPL